MFLFVQQYGRRFSLIISGARKARKKGDDPRRVVALPCSEADAHAAAPRAGAKFTPRAPGSVLLHLVGVLPHAVTFVAPLQEKQGGGGLR